MSTKTNVNRPYKTIGIFGFLTSIYLIFFFLDITIFIKNFYEKHFAITYSLRPEQIVFIKFVLILVIITVICLSSFFYFNIFIKIRRLLDKLIDTHKVIDFLLSDSISDKNHSRFIILTSLLIWPFFHIYLIVLGEPVKESIFEKYITILFLISSLTLTITAVRVFKDREILISPIKIITILVIMATSLMFIFGEEISWGQRIFDWESTGVYNNYNFQKETNIHNFINPLFRFIYPIIGVSFYLILIFVWFFPNYKSQIFDIFIPPRSFIFITFLLGATSFRGHSEIFEGIFAIFCLLYSVRLFRCLRVKVISKNYILCESRVDYNKKNKFN